MYNNDEDKFLDYFTQYTIDGISVPKREKYSIIDGGSTDSFGETFFRGAKLKFKKRIENKKKLNFNIENIGVYRDGYFNDYKFSAVLTNNTEEPIKYTFIENKKFKNITFVIEANLDDYYLNRSDSDELFLDRSCLYVIENKYDDNGEFADINIGGAIVPFLEDSNGINQPNFTIANDGTYIISGIQNALNGSIPNFNRQIVSTENGSFNNIEITIIGNNKIIISDIISVTNKTIKAKKFEYKAGNIIYPFTLNYNNIFPTEEQVAVLDGIADVTVDVEVMV